MKVLFITKHIPYRANSGTTIRINNLLTCLTRAANIACAYIVDGGDDNDRNLRECKLPVTNYLIEGPRQPFAWKRYLIHLCELFTISGRIRKELAGIVDREKPDIIWLECGYLGHYVPFLRKFGVPVVYGSHNSQFRLDYLLWRSNGNWAYRLKMAPFVLLYFIHEKLLLGRPDIFCCISRQDLSYYERLISPEKLRLLPFFFNEGEVDVVGPADTGHPFVCMIGSLRSYQNYEAAIFALERIWPILQMRDRRLHLYIVGALPAEGSQELRRLSALAAGVERVVLTGIVDTVIPLVKGALVNLVPLLIGSGVRTKIIESVVCGTPVVSTTIGAEGLPFVAGESIAIADTAEGLAEKVLQLVNDKRMRSEMAGKAFLQYQEELSCEAGVRVIKSIFRDLKLQDA